MDSIKNCIMDISNKLSNREKIIVNTNELEWFNEFLRNRSSFKNYISSGYNSLDGMLDGFYCGSLYIVGARPGIGKTTFIMNILANLKKFKILLFTTEISKGRFLERFLALICGLDYKLVRTGQICLTPYLDKIKEYNISICDIYRPTRNIIFEALLDKIDIIFFDYFQNIMVDYSASRYIEFTKMVEFFENIAKSKHIPVVLVSQLHRYDRGKDDFPILSDLKETGKLEETAQAVILLSRKNDNLLVDIVKSRDGSAGRFEMSINLETNKLNDTL